MDGRGIFLLGKLADHYFTIGGEFSSNRKITDIISLLRGEFHHGQNFPFTRDSFKSSSEVTAHFIHKCTSASI